MANERDDDQFDETEGSSNKTLAPSRGSSRLGQQRSAAARLGEQNQGQQPAAVGHSRR